MKFLFMALLLFLVGCGSYENDKIETAKVKDNKLLIPSCLERQ